MIKKIENSQPGNVLRIEYMLGNTCNQKCSYCFPGSNEGTMLWPDINIIKTNLKKVLDHYKTNGKEVFNIFFVGGEPTLYEDFIVMCKWLKENYTCILEISTNATRGLSWWADASNFLDHVNISMHSEYPKTNKISKLADYLFDAGIFVNVDVLMDPNNFEKCKDIIEQFKKSKNAWPIIAKVVLYNGQTKYTTLQYEFFNEPIKRYPPIDWYNSTSKKARTELTITFDDNNVYKTNSDSWITRNDLNYFKNWFCNLGVDHIKITNGMITGNCQQKLFDKIYNINNLNFEFNPTLTPTICNKEMCSCTGEITIKKWKHNEFD